MANNKFKRKYKKLPNFLVEKFEKITYILSANPYHHTLKTHDLSGKLKNQYSCSLDYKTRIIFEIKDNEIKLIDIGSHDLYK